MQFLENGIFQQKYVFFFNFDYSQIWWYFYILSEFSSLHKNCYYIFTNPSYFYKKRNFSKKKINFVLTFLTIYYVFLHFVEIFIISSKFFIFCYKYHYIFSKTLVRQKYTFFYNIWSFVVLINLVVLITFCLIWR